MDNGWLIGLDEVGRGPLAGPVVVAAVKLPRESRIINHELRGIRDSKKLTTKQREAWAKKIKELKIPYAITQVGPQVIDRINISNAANLAACRAFSRLTTHYLLRTKHCLVFLDGGLYLKNKGWAGEHGIIAKTVVKGDETIPAISAASILAKVYRDSLMVRLHAKYPVYGFKKHVGYGTAEHYRAIKKQGVSPVHRLTFLRGIVK